MKWVTLSPHCISHAVTEEKKTLLFDSLRTVEIHLSLAFYLHLISN